MDGSYLKFVDPLNRTFKSLSSFESWMAEEDNAPPEAAALLVWGR